MLYVEILKDRDNDVELGEGTYQLGSQFNKNVFICEHRLKSILYNGLVTVDSKHNIKPFYFKIYNSEIATENYNEEAFPNYKYLKTWNSILFDESEKYMIFNSLLKIETLKHSILEEFSLNRCMLLYGLPGVGKTTFSKALVQKLAIRQNKKIICRTIKCSSLISRFYGDSMKILESIFTKDNKDIVYIFDEADSLLIDRRCSLARNEPLDSVRFVNALLAIIDRRESIFIFITNLKDNLDTAFLNRCDMSYHFNIPSLEQIYNILKSSIESLFLTEKNEIVKFTDFSNLLNCPESCSKEDRILFSISSAFIGNTPRTIKKKIILAFDKEIMDLNRFLSILQGNEYIGI